MFEIGDSPFNGRKDKDIEAFRGAVKFEDKLNYNEPSDRDIPTREFLGRALPINGEYAEAENYREELVKHRHNARALFGLAEALKKHVRLLLRQIKSGWNLLENGRERIQI